MFSETHIVVACRELPCGACTRQDIHNLSILTVPACARQNPTTKSLTLDGCGIGDEGCKYLAKVYQPGRV